MICKSELPQTDANRNVPKGLEESLDKTGDGRGTSRHQRRGEPTQSVIGRRAGSGAQRKPSARIPIPTEDESDKIVAWLCCDPLPPIPLGPKRMLTLGRADTCDLVLPHKEVSRVHGIIKVSANVIVFEDEGSSNGSYLNSKRISNSIMKEGDRLTLGPYELEIRSRETMDDKPSEDTTSNLDLTSVARVKPSAAMTGLLEEVPMTEILQQIEFNKKTGTLTVWNGLIQGELSFKDGLPLSAVYDDKVGAAAVLAMIELPRGRFSLGPELENAEPTIPSTLTGLLLEASRRLDEATEETDYPVGLRGLSNADETINVSRRPSLEDSDSVEADWMDPTISDVASGWGHLDED